MATEWQSPADLAIGAYRASARVGVGTKFFRPEETYLGPEVRVDAYCVITCPLEAWGYNHVSSFVFMNGGKGTKVKLSSWAFVGAHSRLITTSDDYSGEYGPIGPAGKNLMHSGNIVFGPYSGVAVNVTVLPGVVLPEGVRIATGGTINKKQAAQLEPWGNYACGADGSVRRISEVDRESVQRLGREWMAV